MCLGQIELPCERLHRLIIEGVPLLEYAQRVAGENFRAPREDIQQPVGMRHDCPLHSATPISVPQKWG